MRFGVDRCRPKDLLLVDLSTLYNSKLAMSDSSRVSADKVGLSSNRNLPGDRTHDLATRAQLYTPQRHDCWRNVDGRSKPATTKQTSVRGFGGCSNGSCLVERDPQKGSHSGMNPAWWTPFGICFWRRASVTFHAHNDAGNARKHHALDCK